MDGPLSLGDPQSHRAVAAQDLLKARDLESSIAETWRQRSLGDLAVQQPSFDGHRQWRWCINVYGSDMIDDDG